MALIYTSKWFYNLYWDFCQTLQFWKDFPPSILSSIVSKASTTELRHIDLSYTKVSNDHLDLLATIHLPYLKMLVLDATPITDRGLLSIARQFPTLEQLSVSYCNTITDYGMKHIGDYLTNLECLRAKNNPTLTDNTFQSIGKLHRLRSLCIECSPHVLLELDKGEGIPVYRDNIGELRALIGDSNLSEFRQLTQLVALDLGSYTPVTTQSMEHLTHLTRLKSLTINTCQLMDSESIALLGRMTQLVTLTLGCISYGVTMTPLTMISNLKYLRVLGSWIVGADLLELAKLKNLLKLYISKCRLLTVEDLILWQAQVEKESSIEAIYFNDCAKIQPNFPFVKAEAIRNTAGEITHWKTTEA